MSLKNDLKTIILGVGIATLGGVFAPFVTDYINQLQIDQLSTNNKNLFAMISIALLLVFFILFIQIYIYKIRMNKMEYSSQRVKLFPYIGLISGIIVMLVIIYETNLIKSFQYSRPEELIIDNYTFTQIQEKSEEAQIAINRSIKNLYKNSSNSKHKNNNDLEQIQIIELDHSFYSRQLKNIIKDKKLKKLTNIVYKDVILFNLYRRDSIYNNLKLIEKKYLKK